jgi:hypothetical protein
LDCIYTQVLYTKLPDELLIPVQRKKYQKPLNYKPNINNEKPVYQYDKDGNFIREYKSRTQAAKEFNINISQLVNCTKQNNKCKTAGNYQWKNEMYDKIEPYINLKYFKKNGKSN